MKQKVENQKENIKPNNKAIKELEDQEEETGPSKLEEFVKQNRNIILIVSGILILAIAAFFYIRSTMESSSLEASVALSRIAPYVEKQQFEIALKGDPSLKVRGQSVIGLLAIIDKYGSTKQGKVAALYAADCYMGMNQPEEAKKYFDQATDSESELIQAGANAGMGVYYEHKGNLKESAKYYEKAAELSGETDARERYLYYAALCYENSGSKDKAIAIYKDIILTKEYSEFSGLAKTGLARLGTIIE